MNNKKILNIKIYEDDYNKILLAIMDNIVKLNRQKENAVDLEDINKINSNIQQYKMLLTKLRTCKLYNED